MARLFAQTPPMTSVYQRVLRPPIGMRGKFQAGGLHYVRQKTYVVVRASILCHLGGGAACAGRGKRTLGLRSPGANIPIGTADRKHRSAANRQHNAAANWLNRAFDCSGIESDQSERAGHATLHDESE